MTVPLHFSVVRTSHNIWLWCSWIWVRNIYFEEWCLQFWRGDVGTLNRQNVIWQVLELLNDHSEFWWCVLVCQLLHFLLILIRTRIRGEQFLVRWAVPQLHDIDSLSRMVDPALEGKYPVKSVSHFADIISRCVQVSWSYRLAVSFLLSL